MVMSFCSGVKHPMTQKQGRGNHGVSDITEIWYLIQTFSFSLQSSKQTLCHLLSVFFSAKIDEEYSTTSLPIVVSIETVGTSIHYVAKHQPCCWDTKHIQACTAQEQHRDDNSKGGIKLADIYGAGLRVCIHKVIVHASSSWIGLPNFLSSYVIRSSYLCLCLQVRDINFVFLHHFFFLKTAWLWIV